MKKLFTLVMLLCSFAVSTFAQKTVYIPNEWRNPWPSDSLLYAESDPEGKYTWSKTRSMESDNVILFWDKYYTKNPKELSKSDFYYVDMDYLLSQCEEYYQLESTRLGFVDPETSNVKKYKIMVLMNHTQTWTCYGGGYDFMVPALWLNPSTCKPVGSAVAHEVGHSFHYMCFAEHSGHKDSDSDNTGFHLSNGNGQTIWETTANWQSLHSFPQEFFDMSYMSSIYNRSHNYAFSHEWHRYQAFPFLTYLCEKYNDITTVAQVWNTPMTGQSRGKGSDFNQALMKLKDLSVSDIYKLHFDFACHAVTWDMEFCKPYRQSYHIGNFVYRCALNDNDEYQVALASCPQSTGYNVIPLQIPAAGTEVKVNLTGLAPGAELLDIDPGEYLDGESNYVKLEADANGKRRYQTAQAGSPAWRGFRMGYVALMADGTTQYFSEDKIYCQGRGVKTESYAMTVPEGVSRLWLVVAPALTNYITHRWDDKIADDDMWPYSFTLEGTDLGTDATIYAAPTLDGRDVADITFTYDVVFPADASSYSGTTISVNGRPGAALGTAFQYDMSKLTNKMQAWDERGPQTGKIMFYALTPNGELASSGSTANGYGHWFSAGGNVTSHGSGYLFSEFVPSLLAFTIGQKPGVCNIGDKYTIRQALRYQSKRNKFNNATFIFNVTIGGTTGSATLRSMDYTDPRTQGVSTLSAAGNGEAPIIYNIKGQRLNTPQQGLNIINGQKYLVR